MTDYSNVYQLKPKKKQQAAKSGDELLWVTRKCFQDHMAAVEKVMKKYQFLCVIFGFQIICLFFLGIVNLIQIFLL